MNRILLFTAFLFLFQGMLRAQHTDTLEVAKVFELGEIKIISAKSKNSVSQQLNIQQNTSDIAQSLSTLPSVTFTNIGSKNEASVYIRGFDIRSIPVFIDGIPVYTTYDGYVDLGRFKTFDYSLVSVTKGFSPMEFGANTIGGAINLVSLKPTKKLEIQATGGMASGNSTDYGINLGSRINKFYFQGSLYKTKSDFFPLSENYQSSTFENGKERENSYSNDQKLNLKVGFAPNSNHEISLNYINQQGEKGNPPYSGVDENMRTRFWQWPAWDKQSFYFISKNKISKNTALKLRFFYDEFYNELESYDDETYSSQNFKSSFTSIYNDHSWGGNLVFLNNLPDKNSLRISIHYKNDVHKEHNLGEPVRNFSDFTWSAGLDENFQLSPKIQLKAGASYNYRKGLQADDFDSKNSTIFSFPLEANSAVNAQIGADYFVAKNNTLSFYVANRTRFATLKDRYSYRLGRSLPNPGLNAENAIHTELSYKSMLNKQLSFESAFYYIQLNNTIQLVDNVEPGISQMQNTGKASFKGFDFSGNYSFAKWGTFLLNYSFIDRKNLDNPDLFFTDVPKHKIFSDVKLIPAKNLETNFSAEYNSMRYSTSYGTTANSFVVFHLFAHYKIKNLTFYSGIKNIFDKNYAFQEGYPAPGRNYFVKLVFEFNAAN